MTTGNVLFDGQTVSSETLSCGGSPLLGGKSHKAWEGGDSPNPKARGENPYTMSWSSETDSLVTWSLIGWEALGIPETTIFTGTARSCGFTSSYQLRDWNDEDELKLLAKIGPKMRGHNFNFAVTAGESPQAIKLIAATAANLANSMKALKRFDVVGSLKHLGLKPRGSVVRDVQEHLRDGLANAWLSLTYGVKPMIMDAGNAAEAIAANIEVPRRIRVVVTRKIEGEVLGTGLAFRSVKYTVTFTDSQEPLSTWDYVRPETVAWELIPFSFVADWFLPVGQYLEAVTSLRAVRGTYVKSDFTRISLGLRTPPGHVIRSGSFRSTEVILTRTIGSVSDLPERVPTPTWKNPLSVSHATSAISLLQQVFGKKVIR